MKPRIVFHAVAVIVLAATVSAAQSSKEKPSQPAPSQDRQYSAPSVSEREAGSGMATGKRQHQPVIFSHELATDNAAAGNGSNQPSTFESGVVTARETGSGMATGKRQHQPVTITAREVGSGMATGRREAQPDAGSNQPTTFESGVTTARETGSGMATGRRSGSVIIMNDDSDIAARDAASGMATGKRVSGDPHENLNSRNSAHATEALDVDAKHKANMSDVQSNPMYKDRGMQGTNPLYEGKDRTAAPPSSNGSQPAQYKDGEDGTTHTRPGNHKPGTVK